MSSLDRRNLLKLGLVAGMALTLSACFKPLYGPTASGGNLAAILAAIEVEKVGVPLDQEEFAHELRNDLIYQLNGSGLPTVKTHKLRLGYSQGVTSPIIDSETGRATTSSITGTVDYTLISNDGKTISAQGRVQTLVTYERPSQRFASLRALRDARLRMAKELAVQIRTRLAATLSSR